MIFKKRKDIFLKTTQFTKLQTNWIQDLAQNKMYYLYQIITEREDQTSWS